MAIPKRPNLQTDPNVPPLRLPRWERRANKYPTIKLANHVVARILRSFDCILVILSVNGSILFSMVTWRIEARFSHRRSYPRGWPQDKETWLILGLTHVATGYGVTGMQDNGFHERREAGGGHRTRRAIFRYSNLRNFPPGEIEKKKNSCVWVKIYGKDSCSRLQRLDSLNKWYEFRCAMEIVWFEIFLEN